MFFRTSELFYFRQTLGKFITTVCDLKMKGQMNFHVLIKRMNGFIYIPVCGKKDLRLLRKITSTAFLPVRIDRDRGDEVAVLSGLLSSPRSSGTHVKPSRLPLTSP